MLIAIFPIHNLGGPPIPLLNTTLGTSKHAPVDSAEISEYSQALNSLMTYGLGLLAEMFKAKLFKG